MQACNLHHSSSHWAFIHTVWFHTGLCSVVDSSEHWRMISMVYVVTWTDNCQELTKKKILGTGSWQKFKASWIEPFYSCLTSLRDLPWIILQSWIKLAPDISACKIRTWYNKKHFASVISLYRGCQDENMFKNLFTIALFWSKFQISKYSVLETISMINELTWKISSNKSLLNDLIIKSL